MPKTHLNLYVSKFGAEIYFGRQSAVGNFLCFFFRVGTHRQGLDWRLARNTAKKATEQVQFDSFFLPLIMISCDIMVSNPTHLV